MADKYIGNSTKTSTSLIKILGPAIGVIKNKSVVREEAIIFAGQTGEAVILDNCGVLFKRIGKAYYNWCNQTKNFNDLGGKDKSIRFRVTEDRFIANTNANAKNDYASDLMFKPLQFYIQKLQPLQEKHDEVQLLGKVLRAFRDMPDGEPTQVTGRHPLEVSMYVWAAIYHDWLHAGRPNGIDWFIEMFEKFFEHKNLSLVLYKCFRGAPTSNEQLLQRVEQECIDQHPYLDEPEEEAVPEKKAESMDVDKPKPEHVCNHICADLHYIESVSSEKFLKENPDIKKIIPLLMQRRYENDIDAVPCSSSSSSKTADPVLCASLSTSSQTATTTSFALINLEANPQLKDAELQETRHKVKQAAYVEMLQRVEDVSRLECPGGFCRQSIEEGEECDNLVVVNSDDEYKFKDTRDCPKCHQFYHAACRKANNNKCVKCGHVGRRDESSSDEEDEEDDGDKGQGEGLDVEMDDVEKAD